MVKILILLLSLSSTCWAGNATPVMLGDMRTEKVLPEGRAWKKPSFKSDPDFAVPGYLREQVDFWMDIYSKYNSNQGLLHDADNIQIIYGVVNLPSTHEDARTLQKLRENKVKDSKKEVKDRLSRLQDHLLKKKSADGLEGEDLRVWKLFENIKGRYKFRDAKAKNRLRLQLGQKDRFQLGIFYSGRYLERMEKVFRERDLPLELTRLPFVESTFNIFARSRVGASGIWQFMPSSGKQYMKVNHTIDERNDPMKATVAAAKMLKKNYQLVKSWPLAVTGYNYGVYGIRRLVKKYRSNDLGVLMKRVKRNRFGFASKNFYASFLAAIEVERRADEFFEKPRWGKPLEKVEVQLTKSISWKTLLSWFDDDKLQAQLYNPFFTYRIRKGLALIPRRTKVYFPIAKESFILAELDKIKEERVSLYRIRSGDNLIGIARRFGVSVRDIMQANGIKKPNRIWAGQKLVIP